MSSNNYSSKSFRSDSINFIHQSAHSTENVKFNTSNNFEFLKPLQMNEIILDDTFKIIHSGGSLVVQKKVENVWTDYFKLT